MKLTFTKSTLSFFAAGIAMFCLLGLPVSASHFLKGESSHFTTIEDETPWALASTDRTSEGEVDWTLAKNKAEEDETDWTLASKDRIHEEEVDWTLA